jgi:hypothetical protein
MNRNGEAAGRTGDDGHSWHHRAADLIKLFAMK